MENEQLIIDFKDVRVEDKARIKSSIEETAKYTDKYLAQKRPMNQALEHAAIDLGYPSDLMKVQAQAFIFEQWVGIDESLGGVTVRETLEKALKLSPQKKLTSIEYRGCQWILYQPDELIKIPDEDRVIMSHKDLTNVHVACGGTLESRKK